MNCIKHLKILSVALIFITLSACKSGSDALAEYRYGRITRGEVKQRAGEAKLTRQMEHAIIESLAVEGMALHEAIATGYDKNETFLLRYERESWPVLKRTVNDMKMSSIGLSWEYVKCRFIAFRGNGTPGGNGEAINKARNTIMLLGKGAEFDSLIKSYSPDPAHAVEQSTMYIVKGGGRPDFEEAVFGLEQGTYTAEPVVLADGTAVVIISDERGTLTLNDLEKRVKNSGERKRLAALFENAAYARIIADMEKNSNASFKVKSFPAENSAVLFTVKGRDYTVKDLEKRRDMFSSIIMEPLENREFLYGFAREWYYHELYRAEAERCGYVNDKRYMAEMKAAYNFILANDYIRSICEKEVIVTDKDMLDEYSGNKNRYMKAQAPGAKKMTQLGFAEAKVFVRKNLVQARTAAKINEWRKRALAESGLVIDD